jgi:phage gp29-like protein
VLPVHRTPLDWLAAGCRGIVVLDFKEFSFQLSALPKRSGDYALGAADLTHARLLRASIGSVGGVRILVPIEAAA